MKTRFTRLSRRLAGQRATCDPLPLHAPRPPFPHWFALPLFGALRHWSRAAWFSRPADEAVAPQGVRRPTDGDQQVEGRDLPSPRGARIPAAVGGRLALPAHRPRRRESLYRGPTTRPRPGAVARARLPLKFDRPLPSLSVLRTANGAVAAPAARSPRSDLWQQTQVSADGLFRDPLADDLPSGEDGRASSPDAGSGDAQGNSLNFVAAGAAPAASADHASAPTSSPFPVRGTRARRRREYRPDFRGGATGGFDEWGSRPASATAPKTAAASP